jgi:enoyl-[acyl-carrier-protein] reductase (NADH)
MLRVACSSGWHSVTQELGRARGPLDVVAKIARFLLSEAWSGCITGGNMLVDGGLCIHAWHPLKEPVLD